MLSSSLTKPSNYLTIARSIVYQRYFCLQIQIYFSQQIETMYICSHSTDLIERLVFAFLCLCALVFDGILAPKKALNIKQTYHKKGFRFDCSQISWIVQTAFRQNNIKLSTANVCIDKTSQRIKALLWHRQTLDYMHYGSKQGAKYI